MGKEKPHYPEVRLQKYLSRDKVPYEAANEMLI